MAGFWGNAVYRRLNPAVPQRMAEIGVFDGQNSGWLLARCPLLTLLMVDQWRAYDDSSQPDTVHNPGKWDRVRRMALARTDFADARRIVLHLTSLEAAAKIPDGSLDLAFVDANHSLPFVQRDIAAYWAKVKRGGWLAGHDYERKEPRIYGVFQAVNEFAAARKLPLELDEDATWFVRRPT